MKRTNLLPLAEPLLAPVFLHSPNPENLRETIRKAENGAPDAQFNLGNCYYNGEGVPEDLSLAAEYYKKAADQGHVGAQNNLAVCYKNGDGVRKSRSEAIMWFRKAAAQGDEYAKMALRELGLPVGTIALNTPGIATESAPIISVSS